MISYRTIDGSTYYYNKACWVIVKKLFEVHDPKEVPELRLKELAHAVVKDNKLVKSRYSVEYLCDLALLDLDL